MVGNYLKIVMAQLRKHKLQALINILGMAVGIASCSSDRRVRFVRAGATTGTMPMRAASIGYRMSTRPARALPPHRRSQRRCCKRNFHRSRRGRGSTPTRQT